MAKILDMTDSKLWGEKLFEEITNRVQATQLFIIQPYPDEILLTEDQFKSIALLSGEAEPTYKEKLLRTKYNVMDIKVEVDHT